MDKTVCRIELTTARIIRDYQCAVEEYRKLQQSAETTLSLETAKQQCEKAFCILKVHRNNLRQSHLKIESIPPEERTTSCLQELLAIDRAFLEICQVLLGDS